MYKVKHGLKRGSHNTQPNAKTVCTQGATHQTWTVPVLADTSWDPMLMHLRAEVGHASGQICQVCWLRGIACAARGTHITVANRFVEVFSGVDDIRCDFRIATIREDLEQCRLKDRFPGEL